MWMIRSGPIPLGTYTERVRSSSPLVVAPRRPINRALNDAATVTVGDRQGPDVTVTKRPDRYRRPAGTIPPTMAKAKRRKLRARRSKANHGRKPNAGRG